MTHELVFEDPSPNELAAAQAESARLAAEAREFRQRAPIEFARAWARGVRLAGPQRMGIDPAVLDDLTDKWKACPNLDLISDRIESWSSGEQVLIATLVGFYNQEASLALFEQCGYQPGMATISAKLEPEGAEVIGQLIRWYRGW